MEKYDPELEALGERRKKVVNLQITIGEDGSVQAKSSDSHPDEAQDKELISKMITEYEAAEEAQEKSEEEKEREEDEGVIRSAAMGGKSAEDTMAEFANGKKAASLGDKVRLELAKKQSKG